MPTARCMRVPNSQQFRRAAKWLLRSTTHRDATFAPADHNRPLLVRFDINNRCNQLCRKCFYPGYVQSGIPGNSISVDDFARVAERLFPHAYYLQLPFAFEPLMHPRFPEILRIADGYAVPNVGIVTNGSLLVGKRAEALLESRHVTGIAVSIDAVDPETFRQMRGRDHLALVLRNIREFMKARNAAGRKFPTVYINSIVMRSNLGVLPKIMECALEMGVDEVQFFHVEPMELANEESALHVRDEYNAVHDQLGAMAAGAKIRLFLPPRYNESLFNGDGTYRHRFTQGGATSEHETSHSQSFDESFDHPYPKDVYCVCPWMVMIVDSWGNYFPCAHRNEPVGNVLRDDLFTAFNSMKQMTLRKQLLRGEREGACLTCRSKSPSSDPLKRRILRSLPEDAAR